MVQKKPSRAVRCVWHLLKSTSSKTFILLFSFFPSFSFPFFFSLWKKFPLKTIQKNVIFWLFYWAKNWNSVNFKSQDWKFGETFEDKNEKWNQPCESMKTEHGIYRYPQILQKGKSPRIYFTIFFRTRLRRARKKFCRDYFVPSVYHRDQLWPTLVTLRYFEGAYRTVTVHGFPRFDFGPKVLGYSQDNLIFH